MDKADGAFLTIGELAKDLGLAQHILRYWETRFPQLRPLQRSGGRRYYRPADVETARRIHQLLNELGFTVRGAQRVLEGKSEADAEVQPAPQPELAPAQASAQAPNQAGAQSSPIAASNGKGQAELALDVMPAPRRSRGQFDSSDIALLIARLTVIRENLVEALGAA
jgi:DNA-binding transcriptional MerR regulator